MSAIGDRLREFAELADKNPDWTGAGCVATPDETDSTFATHDAGAQEVAIALYVSVIGMFPLPERPGARGRVD